ncbi:hypothetical protein Kpol_460p8 [Vanderwaltozyma polyspora DSM 70294]|uniref:J domain-containing protein n=1 Tax=Vanderwaltozyma polyspora (strain ATCC 22028 / DSM 70294 / BCRC 21397 / CBS 2163 / NBRC 10782 / NRRL Y-8283 / UCD 57-17) TaxID=436907 RepID=A7TQS4_VANPO|nr:uncharacterized protein Kpol_460p8 [Vanderwaltozyma polyspora DSM 70294]EDO15373.1 hypothetical protein Kpol_460p8 [Vanderwaltozyma polyspora DSM 70294]
MLRVPQFILVTLLLVSIGYCFTTGEVEIFQLQQELIKKYGEDMNFYKFLKLPKLKDSTSKEIVKNLKKLSKKYHPDKNKKYAKLYERLNIATTILSDDTRRKTYDYYLKNGFPDYDFSKGGFFFKRIQPKTWFILSFIYLASSLIHYSILWIQHNSSKKRIENFIKTCREQDDTNGLGERRVMFKQHAEDPGKEFLIKFGEVSLIEEDGTHTLISTNTLAEPTIYDCMFFRLPIWTWNVTLGRVFNKNDTKQSGNKLGKKSSKQSPKPKKEPKIYEIRDDKEEKKDL